MALSPKSKAIAIAIEGTDEPGIVFRAKDQTMVYVLRCARVEAVQAGADQDYVDSLDRLTEEVLTWQRDNPTQVPDLPSDDYTL